MWGRKTVVYIAPWAMFCPQCGEMLEHLNGYKPPDFSTTAVCRSCVIAFSVRAMPQEAMVIPYPLDKQKTQA